MHLTRRLAAGAALVLIMTAVATRATAAELRLEFRDGRVTLSARDVSVRQILDEWVRAGQTQIDDRERVQDVPITLELEAMPERQALDVILRSAAGYAATTRPADGSTTSVYRRIVVLAESTPVASPPPPPFAAAPAPAMPFPLVAASTSSGFFQPSAPAEHAADSDPPVPAAMPTPSGVPSAAPNGSAVPGFVPVAPPSAAPAPGAEGRE